jgi:uncharacterized protein YcnI
MHRTARTSALLGACATSLVLIAGPALAHVTVQGPGATQGGFGKIAFRVPTEKEVPTTKLQVVFPTDAPLANAGVKPHPGWTYSVVKVKPAAPLKDDDGNTVDQVVQSITWTATAGGIKPGEFDEFELSAGPFPKTDQMVFKALQTYGDGSVVRWIEPTVAGGAEAEHPAPVLKLAAATDGASAAPSASASAAASPSEVAVAATSASSDSEDKASKGLAYTGLGLAALALLVGLAGLLRRGRGPAQP